MKYLAEGIVGYSSLYVVLVLLAVTAMTGRYVFLFMILLTIGLATYLIHQATVNEGHFVKVGQYLEAVISKVGDTWKKAWNKTP